MKSDLSAEQRMKLAQDLPRDVVKQRKQGGGSVSFVEGWYVISRLNEVFGADGWSITMPPPVLTTAGGRVVVSTTATLTAAGVSRTDVGAAVAAGDSGDALETALKAAATDALKRCARTFGPSLGLALYDKAQGDVGQSFACQDLLASLAAAADHAMWAAEHGDAIKALAEDEQAAVRLAYRARLDAAARAATPKTPAAPPPATPADIAEAADSAFRAAATVEALDAAVRDHAKALAGLTEGDRAALRDTVRSCRARLAAAALTADLLTAAGQATTYAAAQAVYARLTAAAQAGRVTADQARAVTEALNERLSIAGDDAQEAA